MLRWCKSWKHIVALPALILVVVIALRFATPIQDGDLFWHMAYARQILSTGSLIPDHTLYSWTPAATGVIYCSWLSELFLYFVYSHVGLAGLFAFRYFCVAVVLGLAVHYAWQTGAIRSGMAWLALLLLTLTAATGTFIKPEMLSLVFFSAVVWAYFQYRRDGRARWLYLVPGLMTIWVNCHGGFILAGPFLAAVAVGEALRRQPLAQYRHLLAAWGLAVLATMATPYGPGYVLSLIGDYVLPGISRPSVAWNAAYQPIYGQLAQGLHFVQFGIGMGLMLIGAALLCRRARKPMDWTLLFINAVYVPFFIVYVRSTFYWPPVFAFTFFFLLGQLRDEPALAVPEWLRRGAVAAVFLFVAGRAGWESYTRPEWGSWLGFGIGYVNPVPEAEFLAAHNFPSRLINFFDGGGYLLWRLYPRYRVMVDSRSFPYRSWLDEERAFERGEGTAAFLERHPADVAVIDLLHRDSWEYFLSSREWRPVFYGPTAAIFLKRTVAYDGALRSEVGDLRSSPHAFQVFHFAHSAGDYETAWHVLEQLKHRLGHQFGGDFARVAEAYREGHRALRAGDWTRAREKFSTALRNGAPGERDRLILLFLNNLAALPARGSESNATTYQAALRKLAAPE